MQHEPRSENKIILVIRHTRLDELISRFNTVSQAAFYVKHMGGDFSDYALEDETYKAAVRQTGALLSRHGRLQVLERGFVPNFVFGPHDTVVALGQDGLVANVLKYLDGQPLIGVNPDPGRWEGVLLPFKIKDLDRLLPDVFAGKRPLREVTMAEARLNTGETLRAVNDLFIGPRTHTSARYTLRTGDKTELQSSSGIIISTGLGATGWLRSILAGAAGIAAAVSGEPQRQYKQEFSAMLNSAPAGKKRKTGKTEFSWASDYLYFSVREPWPSTTSSADITFGKITPGSPLVLTSHMPENGVIFSDGMESDFMKFTAGTEARIQTAEKKGQLVG